ncbi:MAG: hypothetical protein M9913_23915 [Bryobacteraceae bacterium]|nr:hypothetical protein [Bryobacteraceae bacterium]
MQLYPQLALLQTAHVFQQHLFPRLEAELGTLSPQPNSSAPSSTSSPLEPALHAAVPPPQPTCSRSHRPRHRLLAKAVLTLPTTRQLIDRLKADSLRRLCGWHCPTALPHESKFSRAFALFAHSELPQQLHAALIASTQKDRLIGHIARDSTAIEARERPRSPP